LIELKNSRLEKTDRSATKVLKKEAWVLWIGESSRIPGSSSQGLWVVNRPAARTCSYFFSEPRVPRGVQSLRIPTKMRPTTIVVATLLGFIGGGVSALLNSRV
jgi:hypothetical protein